jgi:TRAP-type C4-dicarboxylate transport system permease small subunit
MNQPTQSNWSRPVVKLLEWLLILAMGLLVLDVLWGVISRALGELKAWSETSAGLVIPFLPDGQSSWTEELARFLLIWTSMLGAALAFERRAHLGVDYLVGKFHPDAQKSIQLISHLLVLTFAGLVLLKGGWMLVETTLSSGQVTPALGLKKWVVYAVVPVSGVFVILFTIQNLLRDLSARPREEEG